MPGLQLILASSSPQRRLLLRQLGIDVKIVPPHVDEVVREGEDPKDFVTRLALAKAKNVAS
jgi:septum formation protein